MNVWFRVTVIVNVTPHLAYFICGPEEAMNVIHSSVGHIFVSFVITIIDVQTSVKITSWYKTNAKLQEL